tara:strand:+ start:6460 stop:6660 length:201 start_codon:yes stop_codon:yes gene_type:complete
MKTVLNNNWIKYSNLGFQIIATIAIFGWIGYLIDSSYPDSKPYFLISLLFVGVAVALYQLWIAIFK